MYPDVIALQATNELKMVDVLNKENVPVNIFQFLNVFLKLGILVHCNSAKQTFWANSDKGLIRLIPDVADKFFDYNVAHDILI